MRRMCVGSVQWPGKTTRRSTIPVHAVAASSTCTRSVCCNGLITAMCDNVRYTSCVCVARDLGCFSVYLSCSWSGLRYKIGIRKISLLRIWCDTPSMSHYDHQKAQQHLVAFVYLADLALSGFPFGPILCAPVRKKTLLDWFIHSSRFTTSTSNHPFEFLDCLIGSSVCPVFLPEGDGLWMIGWLLTSLIFEVHVYRQEPYWWWDMP